MTKTLIGGSGACACTLKRVQSNKQIQIRLCQPHFPLNMTIPFTMPNQSPKLFSHSSFHPQTSDFPVIPKPLGGVNGILCHRSFGLGRAMPGLPLGCLRRTVVCPSARSQASLRLCKMLPCLKHDSTGCNVAIQMPNAAKEKLPILSSSRLKPVRIAETVLRSQSQNHFLKSSSKKKKKKTDIQRFLYFYHGPRARLYAVALLKLSLHALCYALSFAQHVVTT
jgi:hypothetical protein